MQTKKREREDTVVNDTKTNFWKRISFLCMIEMIRLNAKDIGNRILIDFGVYLAEVTH